MMRRIATAVRNAGIARGTAFVVERRERETPATSASAADPDTELERFRTALGQARQELEPLAAESDIFAAHLEMVDDPMLSDEVEIRIASLPASAEQALGEAAEQIAGMLAELEDEYLRSRADDVRDVCARIRRALTGEAERNPFADLAAGTIVVADELVPSDTALMDFTRIAGFVTARGSTTSHVAIVARNKGVTALIGTGDAILSIRSGDRLIVDGDTGEILVDPDPETERRIASRLAALQAGERERRRKARLPAVTRSGRPIPVLGNAGSVDEVREALDAGAEGIGLFRSEFLYMSQREGFPDEQTQFAAYRAAAELCGERPLIIRTLDIGGDKALPYLAAEPEDNPFLGWRAVRISLAMHEMFRTQLRALLRASAFGNVRIMFPMIVSVDEFRAAKALTETCMRELDAEGEKYNPRIELGVMIETPAAVMIADRLAAEARFFSIGTNDLTQYVMAADRGNPRVAHLYNPLSEAMQRSIRRVLAAAREAGIEAGMCGELAADPEATPHLVAWGLEEFSVGAGAVAGLKERIREIE